MDKFFNLPVTYEDVDLMFEASHYAHKRVHWVCVHIEGMPVTFQPDGGSNFTVIFEHPSPIKKFEIGLLRAIMDAIEGHDFN